ncbi:MAG: hypothetical protein A2086_06620 [Spirochaetes bacterium GWD1_27_9]|nr:MAG: hypothetical protein A2Y34_08030 [Spirochaetes bacterium GWC1_27_15]OHD41313.1 MAG: hypothetical protein A2086_06620 [Spirochaetes bacterium GWD1_27_9]
MTFFVFGDEDVVLGFKFIGISGLIIESKEDALLEFEKITKGEYGEIGVLIITERIALMLEDIIMDWQLKGEYPLIVEVPDMEGHIEGKKSMLESIRKAIGLSV